MPHIKVIICTHTTQNSNKMNKKHLVNLNQTFQCACNDTYGSHRLVILRLRKLLQGFG